MGIDVAVDVQDAVGKTIAITGLPEAPSGAVEGMFARLGTGGSLALWRPDLAEQQVPLWFQVPRRMHWVGGLYGPETDPSQAFQPYRVIRDFDGIAYVPTATAEDAIAQPHIPARTR